MKYRIALCQTKSTTEKKEAMQKVKTMVNSAAANGVRLVALPEMWNCPYSNQYFREYAERENGETVDFMSQLAKKNGIYLIGGSIPELAAGKVYNTSFSFDPKGRVIGKHRKINLFDVNIKGKMKFYESDTLTAGDQITVFDTDMGKIGVAICYDVRFPELFRKMTREDVHLIVLPAAFNMTTGPAHWEVLMRARAIDNQIYFAAVSPARDMKGVYRAYGNSCLVNPWGDFVAKADKKEELIYGEIDLDYLEDVREQMPQLAQRLKEIY